MMAVAKKSKSKAVEPFRFRLSTFLLICGGGPALLWALYSLMPIPVWSGAFDLLIQLQPPPNRSIIAVSYETLPTNQVEYAKASGFHLEMFSPKPIDLANGQVTCRI